MRKIGVMIRNNKGSLFVVALLLMGMLLVLGSAFLAISFVESRSVERQRLTIQAFHVAEAGIEQAIYYLRKDFVSDLSSPSWADGDIYGIDVSGEYVGAYPPAGFYPFLSGNLNGGSYSVELKNDGGSSRCVWVKSTGVVGGATQTIQVYARIYSISPWDNAIFAGRGSVTEHRMINGNVDIRGSVHILGSGLESTDPVVELGGTAELIGNNYDGLAETLRDKVPELPTTVFNGENVETLYAELRVKTGVVILDGDASVGRPDESGDTSKETVDGVYVTDGFAGNSGISNVFSDNGWSNPYDMGDTLVFPSLSDPYGGYATYQEYLRDHALVIDDAASLGVLANITPNSDFSFVDVSNGYGSISMDGNGNLTIDGIVYIDGGGLNMEEDGSDKTISYTGTGSIVVTGNTQINVNLITPGSDSYPNNIIGVMSPNDIGIGSVASLDVMGLFYAENKITVAKQTNIMGTIVSNYFDVGSQVPKIYQVPSIVNNLPPGLIGQSAAFSMRIISWQKI